MININKFTEWYGQSPIPSDKQKEILTIVAMSWEEMHPGWSEMEIDTYKGEATEQDNYFLDINLLGTNIRVTYLDYFNRFMVWTDADLIIRGKTKHEDILEIAEQLDEKRFPATAQQTLDAVNSAFWDVIRLKIDKVKSLKDKDFDKMVDDFLDNDNHPAIDFWQKVRSGDLRLEKEIPDEEKYKYLLDGQKTILEYRNNIGRGMRETWLVSKSEGIIFDCIDALVCEVEQNIGRVRTEGERAAVKVKIDGIDKPVYFIVGDGVRIIAEGIDPHSKLIWKA